MSKFLLLYAFASKKRRSSPSHGSSGEKQFYVFPSGFIILKLSCWTLLVLPGFQTVEWVWKVLSIMVGGVITKSGWSVNMSDYSIVLTPCARLSMVGSTSFENISHGVSCCVWGMNSISSFSLTQNDLRRFMEI